MFTIKHVSNSGGETLYQGKEPTFVHCGSAGANTAFDELGQVHYTDERSEVQTLRGGRVYVMNDAGKTVATYILDRPLDPSELATLQSQAA